MDTDRNAPITDDDDREFHEALATLRETQPKVYAALREHVRLLVGGES